MIVVKVLTALCVALSLVAGFLLWRNEGLSGDLESAQTTARELGKALTVQTEQRRAEQVVSKQHAETIVVLKQQQRSTDAKLKEALTANRVWTDSDVPSSVLDAFGVR